MGVGGRLKARGLKPGVGEYGQGRAEICVELSLCSPLPAALCCLQSPADRDLLTCEVPV